MRVAYLPLDGRPCNYLFPVQLAHWSGHECVLPERSQMDDFTRPARWEDTRAFLERALPDAHALAISLDQLCYGSLLSSREEHVSHGEAVARLTWLKELLARHPDKPVYAFGVIIRSSISALSAGDLGAYYAMTEYSLHSGRYAVTGDPAEKEKADAARNRVPAPILEKYHRVRARNHEINRLCVNLAREGVFSSLLLLMEDSQEYGFHRQEQEALLRLIDGDGRVSIHNGTDEGGSLAVTRAAACGMELEADVRWLGHPDGSFIASYEDRPFRENVAGALAWTGVNVKPGSEWVLAVAAPSDGRQGETGQALNPADIPIIAREIDALIEAGKKVYLLDVLSANGGSLPLMEAIRQPLLLWGYSAWNTASNALGTAVAQLISDQATGRRNDSFLWERLLDDLFYQGDVRQRLQAEITALGDDPYRLSDRPRAEALLREEFAALDVPLLKHAPAYRLSLPWPRLFEAEIRCEK